MKLIKIILILFTLVFCWVPSHSQQLYPGDVDNNGEVNHIDMLYLGLAHNAVGPPRASQGTLWQPYSFTPWGLTFPNGIDYAFADCDGNGIIDFHDFIAIEQNYGLEHGSVTTNNFLEGTPGVNAELRFDTFGLINPYLPAELVFAPITLGTQNLPATDFYGISFTIEYDPDIFCDNFCVLDFTFNDSWIDSVGFFSFVSYNFQDNDPASGEMEITLVRNDQQAVAVGEGFIGAFVGIIEEDLIDLYNANETTTLLRLNKIKYIDDNFTEIPIVKDTLSIQIIDPDSLLNSVDELDENNIEIFPNPIKESVIVRTTNQTKIQKFQLLDIQGRILREVNTENTTKFEYQVGEISNGIYFVKLLTEKGVVTQKVVIQKE